MSASRERGLRLAAAVTVGLGVAAVAGTVTAAYAAHATTTASTSSTPSTSSTSSTSVTTDNGSGSSQVTSGGS